MVSELPIRVMLLEDSPDDAELVLLALRREGLLVECERFETAEAMERALAERSWDVVISDFSMPSFDARQALDMLLSKELDIPFIVVSGTIGEETAVEMMRAGAKDYLLKDRLHRLGTAVRRELAAVQSRREQLETEQALVRSEVNNRALLKAIPDRVFLIDRTGTLLDFLSSEAAAVHPPESFLHQPISEVLPRQEAENHVAAIQACLDAGDVQTLEYDIEVAQRRKTFETRIAPAGREQVIAIVRDVTASRDLERQVRASQRMEALGRLAGGIAHDFNNLMMVIKVSGDFVRDALAPGSQAGEDIDAIEMAANKATELTRQLLAFSRKQLQSLKVVDVNLIVLELSKLLRPVLSGDMDLVFNLDPSGGLIKADKAQIEQVLMNLVLNARDAMPEGGRLTVETTNVWLDDGYEDRKVAKVPSGPYVMISVSDTGVGMDQEVQAHIFEPFFTTKGGSRGTGLGLATSFGIVKQSNGFIWVYSEVGQGTTFKVYLPRVEREAVSPVEETVEVRELGGTETVLLVEDDDMVRAVAVRLLHDAGYKVLEAEGGTEGLLRCQSYDKPIDLLITDVVMPEMSGRELALQIEGLRPGISVLFVSGYTHDRLGDRGTLEPGVMFLSKPFTRRSLLRKVREILDSRS